MRSKIEAMFVILLDKKAKENGISTLAALNLLLSDAIPDNMRPLICEEYNLSLPEGATFLDSLNIAAEEKG